MTARPTLLACAAVVLVGLLVAGADVVVVANASAQRHVAGTEPACPALVAHPEPGQ